MRRERVEGEAITAEDQEQHRERQGRKVGGERKEEGVGKGPRDSHPLRTPGGKPELELEP